MAEKSLGLGNFCGSDGISELVFNFYLLWSILGGRHLPIESIRKAVQTKNSPDNCSGYWDPLHFQYQC